MSQLDRPARKREMPLVPEPFKRLAVCRQSLFFRDNTFLANLYGKWIPNLDMVTYRDEMTKEKQDEVDGRAQTLMRHSVMSYVDEVSEATWEADVRNTVFGSIRDDLRLRIDKRPYEFVDKSEAGGKVLVKKRIPDATMGLRAYTNMTFNIPECDTEECIIEHGNFPHKSLSKEKLISMTGTQECGLVVDGLWGKADIVFPWGVYEAKRKNINPEKAEDQIYHAVKTYLAMLDDLARDPEDVGRYQSKESKNYQMFCFTSCGPHWGIYIAWSSDNSCEVETIWEGNVMDFPGAYELLCITDQIQKYAANQHRDFVIKHLEAWHKRCDKFKRTLNRETSFEDWIRDYDFEADYRTGWQKAQCASRVTAVEKAGLKRKATGNVIPSCNDNEDKAAKVDRAGPADVEGHSDSSGVDPERKPKRRIGRPA